MNVIWRALTTFVRLVVARWNSIMTGHSFRRPALREVGVKSRAPRYRSERLRGTAMRQRDATQSLNRPRNRARDAEILRRLSVVRGGAHELHRGRIVGGIRRPVGPPADDRAS